MLYQNDIVKSFSDKHFPDEKILKTFPGLRVIGINGETINVADLFPNIQTYYIKFFDVDAVKNTITKKTQEMQNTVENVRNEVTNEN